MTIGEIKNKVYMLLDEHSAGGEVEHDEDIEAKMLAFIDTAQKELAKIKKVIKVKTLERQEGKSLYSMPGDMMGVYRVWIDGKPAGSRLNWIAGKLYIPEYDSGREIMVEYFAMPETIPTDADDDYELEIAEDAAECIPFYVCGQQLLPDLVTDYSAFLMMYDRAVQTLSTALPGANKVRQAFWRG